MALTAAQLALGLMVLVGISAWILIVRLTCPECGARFAMNPTLETRVEGRGRVMQEMRCRTCGWTHWSRKWSDSGDH